MSGRARRGYWDEQGEGGWIFLDPSSSVEDEIFDLIARIEDECSFTPEIVLALDSLTPKQRFVVECRYGFDSRGPLPEREIARLMGVRQRAVQKLLKRALRRMEKQMWEVVTHDK